MDRNQLKELARRQPIEPLEIALTDGPTVLVHRPDQVIIKGCRSIFRLAQIKRTRQQVAIPKDGDAIAKDWMLADLVHVVSVEPVDGIRGSSRRTSRRGK